mgnify:FL=1
MSDVRSIGVMTAAICLMLALTACSDSTDSDSAEGTAASVTTAPTTTGPDPVEDTTVEDTAANVTAAPTTMGAAASTQAPTTTAVSAATTIPPSLLDMRGDLGVGIVVVDPTTETGSPHPTLSWQPVDAAASYWLVLHDADGEPFWAWTGTDTSIRVGGGGSPDINQTAALHQEMTWRVAAFDGEGVLVALSDPAALAP